MEQMKVVAKLQSKVARWVSAWITDPTSKEMFQDDPPATYRAYLHGAAKVSKMDSSTDDFHTWHLVSYENAALKDNRCSLEDFALAAHYARASVQFKHALAEAGKGGMILQPDAALYFALNVLAGWRVEANKLGDLLLRGLDSSLLDLRHNDRHQAGELYRHLWFLLHLYADTQGRKIDVVLYSYPSDMRPYADVLADWRTGDLEKVQGFVSAMADYHLGEARNTAHDEIAEFDTERQMVFPYEILAFLRIREWFGLSNPDTFDHPLMNQPLAELPNPVPLEHPATRLLDEVVAKFEQEFPGSST